MAKVYVFLADGFEDVEALIPIDVLRRGGVEVVTVSTTEFPLVESAHGVNIEADIQFEQSDYQDADLLMLPGGMPGASNLYGHEGVCKAVCDQAGGRSSDDRRGFGAPGKLSSGQFSAENGRQPRRKYRQS